MIWKMQHNISYMENNTGERGKKRKKKSSSAIKVQILHPVFYYPDSQIRRNLLINAEAQLSDQQSPPSPGALSGFHSSL